ncbi:hypothetical protein V1509DRAFT_574194 [Lipomyces kononenkoae]
MSGVVRKPNAMRRLVIIVAAAALLLFISAKDKTVRESATVLAASAREKISSTIVAADENLSTMKASVSQSVLVNESPMVNGKPLDLEFLIPLTSSHFNFCRSLYTALINDYPKPTLINWGKVFADAPQARVRKINGIDEYLHRMRPDQYALIMDGFDVWYQLPYHDLVSHFLELTEPTDYDYVVFGADKKCWPNEINSPACVNIPESTLPGSSYGPWTDGRQPVMNPRERFNYNRPRWLNSGNMIGPVSILREIYDRANYSISHAPPEEVYSDQMYIAEVYGQQDLNMTVDYKSELFQTMTFSHADVIFLEDDLFTYPRKAPSDRRLLAFNKVSGALPPVLHFNGPKKAMDTWWPQMWWSRERDNPDVIEKSRQVYESGGAFTIDGEFLSWNDLCGNADVHSPPPWKPETA